MRNNENINTVIWDSKRSKEMKTIVTSTVTNQKVATDLVIYTTKPKKICSAASSPSQPFRCINFLTWTSGQNVRKDCHSANSTINLENGIFSAIFIIYIM